ncbi:MAG: hypothetical protein Q4B80_01765 [Aerococcaceae bacterium]|nr:hypothetical protein [Aerococcaceae bacterium]
MRKTKLKGWHILLLFIVTTVFFFKDWWLTPPRVSPDTVVVDTSYSLPSISMESVVSSSEGVVSLSEAEVASKAESSSSRSGVNTPSESFSSQIQLAYQHEPLIKKGMALVQHYYTIDQTMPTKATFLPYVNETIAEALVQQLQTLPQPTKRIETLTTYEILQESPLQVRYTVTGKMNDVLEEVMYDLVFDPGTASITSFIQVSPTP